MTILSPNGYRAATLKNTKIEKEVENIELKPEEMDKGNFPHFMLKEIHEKPQAIQRAHGGGGRLVPDFGTAKLGGLNMSTQELLSIN